MISAVLDYIAKRIQSENPFFESYHSAAFRSINGNIVTGYGFDKQDVSISDIQGSGIYIRLNGQVVLVQPTKKHSSMNNIVTVVVPCRMVLYSFSPREINPFALEAKIRQDLYQLDWSAYTGHQRVYKVNNVKVELNIVEALKAEILPGIVSGMAGEDISQVITTFPSTLAYWDFNVEFDDVVANCLTCSDIFCS